MYVRPSAPLSIGGVLDDAIKVYRVSFSRCWIPSLLIAIIAGVIGFWMSSSIIEASGRSNPVALIRASRQPSVFGVYLLQWLLSTGLYGSLFAMQDGASGGQVQDLGEAFGIGFGRLGRALLAGLLFGILLTVGFVLLIVPGFFVLGALCLWPVALFVDNAGAAESVGISRELTRGHWWRTSMILTVAIIIVLVFSTLVGAVAGFLAVGLRHDLATVAATVQMVSVVANVFILPMYTAVLISIYRDLKLRREGGDLAARLGALPAG
jgi:hypothetical protein